MSVAPSIKSQPVYHPIEWDATGIEHLLFIAADEPETIERLLAAPPAGGLTLAICVPQVAERLRADGMTVRMVVETSVAASLRTLEALLQTANMGLRLYLVGPEDDIWQAAALASGFGMSSAEIRLYQTGSRARPVFCVHCRALTRGVRTNLTDCSGCGRTLFVRDHFSRRLGAYMGFQIDAEIPGDKPPVETVYP